MSDAPNRKASLMKTSRLLLALVAPVWLAAAPLVHAQAAPDQDLRIARQVLTIGKDGVQRETRYADRMTRREGAVWIEREMPAALRHDSHSHEAEEPAHVGHAHESAIAAPLWVQRSADGQVRVTMVLRKERKLIDVGPAEYGNVGYGGSWAGAYWVLDPALLGRLKPAGPARAGVQRYEGMQDGRRLRVDWDVAGQYPRRVQSSDAHGSFASVTTVTRVAAPKAPPWREVEGYARGEYSDLLD